MEQVQEGQVQEQEEVVQAEARAAAQVREEIVYVLTVSCLYPISPGYHATV